MEALGPRICRHLTRSPRAPPRPPRVACPKSFFLSSASACYLSKASRSPSRRAGRVVSVVESEDERILLYKKRSERDCTAYDWQVRALAAAAERTQEVRPKRLKPLNQLNCIVDVHYSLECLRQLHEALLEGKQIHVDSVLLPQLGTPKEVLSLAVDVAPKVYMAEPHILAAFRQDVPWPELVDEKDGATARLFRRFEGCRFLVAFPHSTPISEMEPPFVVLDGLNSSSNVGQILRSAYHLGINSVIASPSSWSCLNGRACRVSMGWFYRMNFHVGRPLSTSLKELKDRGVCLYAAENQFSKPVSPHEPNGDPKWALVLGSEFSGVSKEVVELCDERVCVPQQQGHSLNVAHACSICLYELSKYNVMEQTRTCFL